MKLVFDYLKNAFGDRSPHYITRLGTCPVRFVGSEGSVETGDAAEMVVTANGKEPTSQKWDRVKGMDTLEHSRDFIDCIKSRQAPICNSSVMRRSHLACHAASIAWILQRPMKFDPIKEEFINDSEANLLRSRAERNWKA